LGGVDPIVYVRDRSGGPRVNAVVSPVAQAAPYDVARVREQFPVLRTRPHGRRLAFLDTAASAQRPERVLRAVDEYERTRHANVHRGVYQLSQLASESFEGARERVRRFLGAASNREVMFTRGTTEAINLVAQSWGRAFLRPGDEILLTGLEHHANIVPWQLVSQSTGARIRVVPIRPDGDVRCEDFEAALSPRTRIAAFAHVSNALGTVLPVAKLCAAARAVGAVSLVDGAQAVPHENVDVQALGCDFYAFSGHKVYGPTGIGVLWAREAVLETMPPWQGGGDMIRTVSFESSTYNDLPWRFEAGTPNISGAVGLAAALDFVDDLGLARIRQHEHALLQDATGALQAVPGLRILGTAPQKAAVISFTLEGVHPHDLGTILDSEGVAVRAGHHCAMPVMEFFGVAATARASFGCYSDDADVEQLLAALARAREVFA
jgi:cysteine desulfurase / selenocysteine lyase